MTTTRSLKLPLPLPLPLPLSQRVPNQKGGQSEHYNYYCYCYCYCYYYYYYYHHRRRRHHHHHQRLDGSWSMSIDTPFPRWQAYLPSRCRVDRRVAQSDDPATPPPQSGPQSSRCGLHPTRPPQTQGLSCITPQALRSRVRVASSRQAAA